MLPGYTNSNPSCPIEFNNTSLNPSPPPVIIGSGLKEPYYDTGTGNWKVCPTDDTLDKTYEFYVYMKARGGREYVTTKYTYHHGCPYPIATYSQGPSFQTLVTKYITQDKLDVW